MLRLLLFVTLLLGAAEAFAKANGVDSRGTFPPIGCGSADGGAAGECHLQPLDPSLLVTIDGPTQIGTGLGDFGFYTVSIPQGSGGLKGAGVNVVLAAPNGTGCSLETFSSNLRTDDEFGPIMLTHAYEGEPPPFLLEEIWSYQFLVLHCTTPGPLLLLAAMNAFDGSGDEEGEIWNKTELAITVPEPTTALGELGTFLTLLSLVNSRTSPIQRRRRA